MNTKTLTPHDTQPLLPYTQVDRGVIVPPQAGPDAEFVIEQPNGRLRCRALSGAGDPRPTGPLVIRGTVAQAWQELKNYRTAVMEQCGLRRGGFRPHLLSWPGCQPVRRPGAVGVRAQLRAHRLSRKAVAR